jgi:uncharacterized protein (UPF0305 family)
MKFEKPARFITVQERQEYLERLIKYLQNTMPTGAISDETEAQRLQRLLLQNEPIEKSYVDKVVGQLGNPDDRGSLYH